MSACLVTAQPRVRAQVQRHQHHGGRRELRQLQARVVTQGAPRRQGGAHVVHGGAGQGGPDAARHGPAARHFRVAVQHNSQAETRRQPPVRRPPHAGLDLHVQVQQQLARVAVHAEILVQHPGPAAVQDGALRAQVARRAAEQAHHPRVVGVHSDEPHQLQRHQGRHGTKHTLHPAPARHKKKAGNEGAGHQRGAAPARQLSACRYQLGAVVARGRSRAHPDNACAFGIIIEIDVAGTGVQEHFNGVIWSGVGLRECDAR